MNRLLPTGVLDANELSSQLLAAIEQAGLGVTMVLGSGEERRLVYRNQLLETLTGGDGSDAQPDPFAAFVPAGRAFLDELDHAAAPTTAASRTIQTALQHKHGHEVPVELTVLSVPTSHGDARVLMVRDLTERQRIEEAVRDSEADFRSLAEASPDSITVVRAGRMVYANPAAARALGFGMPAELMARPIDQLMCDAEDATVVAERVARMERGERVPPHEYFLRCKDGGFTSQEISSSLITFDGAPACLAFGRDSSQRRALHAELLRSDRLATLGMMAASVAHEINNPLTFMLLNLERLTSLVPALVTDPQQRRHIQTMLRDTQQGGERVRTMVRELLTLARDDHAMGPIAVGDAIETALKLVGPSISHRVRISRCGDGAATVLGNLGRFVQVFVNLILDAADAFERTDDANEIVIDVRRDGRDVVVAIADNGGDIPPERLERIFEPLFTTRAPNGGTRMGLSICRSLVTELGGTIVARSEERRTERIVRLRAVDLAGSQHGVPRAVRRRIRIALIEDDLHLAESVAELIQLHHHIEVFSDARVALASLTDGSSFDHVLCDLAMPGLAGIELYLKLRELRPEYRRRFLFISGSAPGAQVDALVAEGEVGFLAKPFDRDSLLAALERAISVVE